MQILCGEKGNSGENQQPVARAVRAFYSPVSFYLGEIVKNLEMNRCICQYSWLHPAAAITVYSDTNVSWGNSYPHYKGMLEEGDTSEHNIKTQQCKFYLAIITKYRCIFRHEFKRIVPSSSRGQAASRLMLTQERIIWENLFNIYFLSHFGGKRELNFLLSLGHRM